VHKISNLHNWVSELPDAIAAEVRRQFVTRKLIDGEYLYHQGDPPDACYQVAQGRLKVCNYNYAGQELVHTHLIAGDCVGDWGLIIAQPRMNNAVACGDTEINVLRKNPFNALYDKHADIPRALNRVMAQRLRLAFMLSEDASLLPLHQRLARVIIRMAHSLGHVGPDGSITLENISHEELAKMVGAARPSVGRELKKLEQEGFIDIQYGKLVIRDIAAFGEQYDRLLSVEPVVADYD
jgi:CRP/FNR family cyclic AMP-dependent transcriptional regulator